MVSRSQPILETPSPQELQAWADEAQACVDSGKLIISDHRKARATIDALRSHATLKARAAELEGALRALRLQALQSSVNDPANEWGLEALHQANAALSHAGPVARDGEQK
jgi:hypothetical protein